LGLTIYQQLRSEVKGGKMSLEIKRVTEHNIDDFLKLISKLARYEKKNPPDINAQERLIDDALSKNPKYWAYLGKIDSQYIGYIMYYFTYSSYKALCILHIEDLFVLEKFRKKGFGQKLFDFCIKKAKENKCTYIEWTAYNWNEPAIKFFEKNKAIRLNKSYYQFNIE
jgi:GNAT superfamily N-acetyltransferase